MKISAVSKGSEVIGSASSGWLRRRRSVLHQERDAGLGLVIERDVDRVEARIFKSELLDVDDKVASAEVHIVWKNHFNRDWRKIGHDRTPVRIHKIEL